jgi:hypothetical protein
MRLEAQYTHTERSAGAVSGDGVMSLRKRFLSSGPAANILSLARASVQPLSLEREVQPGEVEVAAPRRYAGYPGARRTAGVEGTWRWAMAH